MKPDSFTLLRALRLPLLREATTAALFASLLLQSTAAVAPTPTWWGNQSVIPPNSVADDFAVANVGQLKYFAAKAAAEMNAQLSGGAGADIVALMSAWNTDPAAGMTRDDYAALTAGQLKSVAAMFYDRLAAAGAGTVGVYPWGGSGTVADDYALVNVGQLKAVFAFEVPKLVASNSTGGVMGSTTGGGGNTGTSGGTLGMNSGAGDGSTNNADGSNGTTDGNGTNTQSNSTTPLSDPKLVGELASYNGFKGGIPGLLSAKPENNSKPISFYLHAEDIMFETGLSYYGDGYSHFSSRIYDSIDRIKGTMSEVYTTRNSNWSIGWGGGESTSPSTVDSNSSTTTRSITYYLDMPASFFELANEPGSSLTDTTYLKTYISPQSLGSDHQTRTLTLSNLYTTDQFVTDSEGQIPNFTGNYTEGNFQVCYYIYSRESASIMGKLRYKWQVDKRDTRTVVWDVSFTPVDENGAAKSDNIEHNILTWTPPQASSGTSTRTTTSDKVESPEFTIDPLLSNAGLPVQNGQQPKPARRRGIYTVNTIRFDVMSPDETPLHRGWQSEQGSDPFPMADANTTPPQANHPEQTMTPVGPDPTGSVKPLTEFKIAKMTNTIDGASKLQIGRDPDRFYVRVSGLASAGDVRIQIATEGAAKGLEEHNDPPTEQHLTSDFSGNYMTDWQVLVSNKILNPSAVTPPNPSPKEIVPSRPADAQSDDDYSGDYKIGTDDQPPSLTANGLVNDCTHVAELGSKVVIKGLKIGDNPWQSMSKVLLNPIAVKKEIPVRFAVMSDAGNPDVQGDLKRLNEHYAQVGIKFRYEAPTVVIKIEDVKVPSGNQQRSLSSSVISAIDDNGNDGLRLGKQAIAIVDTYNSPAYFAKSQKIVGPRDILIVYCQDVLNIADKATKGQDISAMATFPSWVAKPVDGGPNMYRGPGSDPQFPAYAYKIFASKRLWKPHTLPHEVGHLLLDQGHYNEEYKPIPTPPEAEMTRLLQHNLMKVGGTDVHDGVSTSKRLYELQEDMLKSAGYLP